RRRAFDGIFDKALNRGPANFDFLPKCGCPGGAGRAPNSNLRPPPDWQDSLIVTGSICCIRLCSPACCAPSSEPQSRPQNDCYVLDDRGLIVPTRVSALACKD